MSSVVLDRAAAGRTPGPSKRAVAVAVCAVAILLAAFVGGAVAATGTTTVRLCVTAGGNVVWTGGGCKSNEQVLDVATADALEALQAEVDGLEADAAQTSAELSLLTEIVGMNGATLGEVQELVGMNGATLGEVQEIVGMNGATLDDLEDIVGMNGATLDELQELVGMNGATLDELLDRVEELEQAIELLEN
jgi:hypothetical protein